MKSYTKMAATLAATGLFGIFALGCARADQITFKFSGVVSSVFNDPSSPLPAPWNGATAGQAWSMTYVFDSATPNSSLDASHGDYKPLVSYSVTVGGGSENGL